VSPPVFDAHCHLWIKPPHGVKGPRLVNENHARRELAYFREAGGTAVIDCQPGRCGRDGRVLARLAAATGVDIRPATGFHLERYYAPQDSPYAGDPAALAERWTRELTHGLEEEPSLRAAVVKSAWTGEDAAHERVMMNAAAAAAHAGGGALVVHTERGQGVEALVGLLGESELAPERVQISHVDKRFDLELHAELAREGFRLGYDAFLRPKYDPAATTWPLIEALCRESLHERVTAGLDLADSRAWRACGGPGLETIPRSIRTRLRRQVGDEAADAIAGANAARLLNGQRVAV
jgi:phosphotriesterase-related protein